MTPGRRTLRLGVVPYLNVQPLIAHLSTVRDNVEIVAAVPSRMAMLLAEGAVDVGIVPVFSLLEHPEWAMVPRVGIASEREVQSVLLVSASPREEMRRVFLDPASMTSSALVQILFRRHWRQEVDFLRRSRVRMTHELGTGYLVIGDRALQLRRQFKHVIDLATAWRAWTDLPFVFAVWAVRPGVNLGPLASQLTSAPGFVTPELCQTLAESHHREVGLSVEELRAYFEHALRFRLGREEMASLRRYLRECCLLGLGPARAPRLQILPRDGNWRRRDDSLTG